MHGANHGNVVNVLGDVGKQFAHLDTALAVFFELKRRLKRRSRSAFGGQVVHRQRFAVEPDQRWFRIESIHVGWAAIGENVNDSLRLGWEVRRPGSKWRISTNALGRRVHELWCQAGQSNHPKPKATSAKKIASSQKEIF